MQETQIREPLHMKWWFWLSIFFITAFVVNATTVHQSKSYLISKIPNDGGVFTIEDITVMSALKIDSIFDTDNIFLVGEDLPSGVYFAMTKSDEMGYLLLLDSSVVNVEAVIWQKHFESHEIITLVDGMFVKSRNVSMFPVEEAVISGFSDNVLAAGTYRVGKDIPPGIYTLFPGLDEVGFVEFFSSSDVTNSVTSFSKNFNEPTTLAFNTGDYVRFLRAEIRK